MPPDPPLLSILSDQPADEDQLGFAPYARTLAEIVAVPGTRTPLTIGIFGDWGRGKTSLMRMVQGLHYTHRRVLKITRSGWLRVTPQGTPDVLGTYVLMPVPEGITG